MRNLYSHRNWLILLFLLAIGHFKVNAQFVPLGEASKFAILAGQTISTNSHIKALNYAGAGGAITGDISANIASVPYNGEPVSAALAHLEEAMAFCSEQGGSSLNGPEISNNTLEAGAFEVSGNAIFNEGELILNGDPTSIFIFNIKGDLIVEEGANLVLGDVKPANIFWNVQGEVKIEVRAKFAGIVIAKQSIYCNVTTGMQKSLLSLGSITISADNTDGASYENSFFSYDELARALGFCDPPITGAGPRMYNAIKGRISKIGLEFNSFGTDASGQPFTEATWELELTDPNRANVIYSVEVIINTLGPDRTPDFTNAFITKYGQIPCGVYNVRDRIYNACTKNTTPFVDWSTFPGQMDVNCFTIALPQINPCQTLPSSITATVVPHPFLSGFALINNQSPSPVRWFLNNTLIQNTNNPTIIYPTASLSPNSTNTLKVEMDWTLSESVNGVPVTRTMTETQTTIIPVTNSLGGNSQVLGDPNRITTFDASQQGGRINFSGDYHVIGHLEFINGTFTLEPGTKFYIDPDVSIPFDVNGSYKTIINVSNATLDIIGATLTSSDCNNQIKWGGIIVTNGSTIYSNRGGSPLKNAEISLSVFAVRSQQMTTANNPTPAAGVFYPNSNFYDLNYTDFFNNTFGFTDLQKNAAAQTGEGIRNCKFYNSDVGIHFAWDDQTNSLYGGDFTNAVFSGNTFNNSTFCAMYGIANNVTITNNDFLGNNAGVVVSPEITATSARTTLTGNNFVIPAGKMGVNAEHRYTINGNSFSGNVASGYASGATGIQAWGAGNEITDGNTFSKLETGLSILPNQDAIVRGNVFSNNFSGVFFPHDAYAFSSATVRCNTFSAPALSGTSHGIFVNTGSTLAELGTSSLPNGNKFDGTVAQPVTNDGTSSLTYYKYGSSSQENLGIQIFGISGGSIDPQLGDPTMACSGQRAGITARQANGSITYTDIQNMMDSLRLGLGSFAELKYFQREIMGYHAQNNQLVGLEAYVHTLQGINQEAYNTLGLYLMDTYRAKGQEQQAQFMRSALVHYNPNDIEIIYRAKYFDLAGKWGSSFPKNLHISAADSTTLVAIAGSGTSPALKACTTLRLLYPQLGTCQAPANISQKTTSSTSLTTKTTDASSLGQGYPNPAQEEVVIPYSLPKGFKTASIQINEVMTGRQVRSYSLKAGESSLTVDLHNLKTGLYTYTLLFEGKPAGTRKLSVVK